MEETVARPRLSPKAGETSSTMGIIQREPGLKHMLIGSSVLLMLLNPLVDSISDANLTLHMTQHFLVIAAGIVAGFGLEKIVIKHLLGIRRKSYAVWKFFATIIKLNVRTKGLIIGVVIPAGLISYWHFPQIFDLAVVNGTIHGLEHISYIFAGLSVGFSILAIPKKIRISLLYLAFMHIGMMGSIWVVSPDLFSLYGAQQNLTLDTSMMVSGAIGVLLTSGLLLKYLDVM
jgi:cytochrome c oxidase assembly factor CtaG